MYGSESWTKGKTEERKLLAFEAWCYRRNLKINWLDCITNEKVFHREQVKKEVF